MGESPFLIELLQSQNRSTFDCGEPRLNEYFRTRVGQDVRRLFTTCFVAVARVQDHIAGFYTLAMGSVPLGDLPQQVAKRLPRYPDVPVARLGRLAVDRKYQGQKLGGSLLADAIARSIGSEIAVFAIVVDAKDDNAVAFYKHFGFLSLARNPKTLFLPISKAIKNLVNK